MNFGSEILKSSPSFGWTNRSFEMVFVELLVFEVVFFSINPDGGGGTKATFAVF